MKTRLCLNGESHAFIPKRREQRFCSRKCVEEFQLLQVSNRDVIKDRFWSLVSVSDLKKCWEYHGPVYNEHGYGMFTFTLGGARRFRVRAHRFVYRITKGKIPVDLDVCHICDNRMCVNPSHLFLGTHIENMQDMAKKGRSPYGENHCHHKLTELQVKEILVLLDSGHLISNIARSFGVTSGAIYGIDDGENWRRLSAGHVSSRRRFSKLSVEQIDEIFKLLSFGVTQKVIAERVGVSQSAISHLKSRRSQ